MQIGEDATGGYSMYVFDDNGNLIYTDNSSYVFSVDDNGYLNWEVA